MTKRLRTRTATRIAARRSGAFNTVAYRETAQAKRQAAGQVGFWGGLAMTVFTGGAALPLAAIFMAPAVADAISNRD